MFPLLFTAYVLAAQEHRGLVACGNAEAVGELTSSNDCFDVGEVQDNCDKIWVKMNLHFFLQDDCSGNLHPTLPNVDTSTIHTVYQKAEDLINWFNLKLQNNKQQWNQVTLWDIDTEQPAQCVPIRYALSGVYVHCNTTAKNTTGSNLSYFKNNFSVNEDSEFNAFFVEWKPTSTLDATGQADGIPGIAFTLENFSSGVFNHEFGHCTWLDHVFNDDDCDDTPQIRFKVDFNCDNDIGDNFPGPAPDYDGVGSENTWRWCWSFVTSPTPMDYDANDTLDYVDACNAPCFVQPCCDSLYLNNNVMAYSGYNGSDGAFTACQITRMLNTLSGQDYCPYVVQVGGECAPPMANVHVSPDEDVSEDCSYCFQLMASMNETKYKVEILTTSNTLIYNHGWKTGQAWQFCIARNPKYSNVYMYGLQANTNYKFRLTLKNACDTEAVEEYTFRLPSLPSGGCLTETAPYEMTAFYPNPFTGSLTVEYDTEVTGNMDIYLFPSGSGSDILLSSEYISTPGSYQEVLNTSSVPTGTYFLVLSLDGALVSTTTIKI